jgi:hypothetical protein
LKYPEQKPLHIKMDRTYPVILVSAWCYVLFCFSQ